MCGGVQYNHEGKVKKVYFPNPYAQLPILKKDGELELVAWGRRKQQEGRLPQGGWARQESIDKGIWEKWSPTPVKIIVDRFMEKDNARVSHWFDLKQGEWIQGLVAHKDDESRVYVVTIEPEASAIHNCWPKILGKFNGVVCLLNHYSRSDSVFLRKLSCHDLLKLIMRQGLCNLK